MDKMKRILIVSEAHLIKTFAQATIIKLKEEHKIGFDCFITTTVDEQTKKSLQAVFDNVFVNVISEGPGKANSKTKSVTGYLRHASNSKAVTQL